MSEDDSCHSALRNTDGNYDTQKIQFNDIFLGSSSVKVLDVASSLNFFSIGHNEEYKFRIQTIIISILLHTSSLTLGKF